MTIDQALRVAFPNEYKSMRKRLDPVPPELARVGYSSRYKILRAAQLHFDKPPIDMVAHQITPLFQHFEVHTAGNQWMLQQYNCIRWALNYSDNDLASSALLRFGQITWSSTGPPIELPSIHKITVLPDGVMCSIDADHTLQERMDYACSNILQAYLNDKARHSQPSAARYFQIGCQSFYAYRKSFVTLSPEMNQSVKARIQVYIDNLLNKLSDKDPRDLPYATIEDPEEWLDSSQSFYLKWEDFNFTDGSTVAQYEQRQNAARNNCLRSLMRNIPLNLDASKPYSRQEILGWIGKNQITNAAKYGFLTPAEKVGRQAFYYLTFLQSDDDESEPKEV